MVNFDVMRLGAGGFMARALVLRVGRLMLAQASSDAICLSRSAERVLADRVDHIFVNYYYRGRLALASEAGVRAGPDRWPS